MEETGASLSWLWIIGRIHHEQVSVTYYKANKETNNYSHSQLTLMGNLEKPVNELMFMSLCWGRKLKCLEKKKKRKNNRGTRTTNRLDLRTVLL